MAVDLTKVTSDLNANQLIQKEISKTILEEVPHRSKILPYMTRFRNLTSNELEMTALSMIPYGGWIDSGSLKPLGGIGWDNRKMMVRELAVVIPIKDSIIEDAQGNGYDVWAEVKKWTLHSTAVMVDQALLWGAEIPVAWNMDNIYKLTNDAGQVKTATADLYQDLMGEDGIETMVEEDGYIPNVWLAPLKAKGKLRGVVDATGQPLFRQSPTNDTSPFMLDGLPINFQSASIWDSDKAQFIVGDFSQFVYAMRQDITFTPFKEGVISDENGKVLINLMQQDYSAMRMVMRMAWGCPIRMHDGIDTATRAPFAILQ